MAAGKERSNALTKLLGTRPEFADFLYLLILIRTIEGLHMPRTAAQNVSQLLEAQLLLCLFEFVVGRAKVGDSGISARANMTQAVSIQISIILW